MSSVANLNGSLTSNLNTFNDNMASDLLSTIGNEMTKSLTNQTMSTQNLPNQITNQTAIAQSNNDATSSTMVTNQNSPPCQKSPNRTANLSKFSNNSSTNKTNVNVNELNKMDMMESAKQSIVQSVMQQKTNLNSVVNSLKRSPVVSPISLLEMQQHSPPGNSECSSIKSSISPGTSLSSSPTHYSNNGYSNVHMLRNSVLNEPTICINQSQTSTIPLANLSNLLSGNAATTFFQQPDKDDGRPVAIVQGKKNRHNLNDDEDDEPVGTVKKFCVNNNCMNNGNPQPQQLQNMQPTQTSSSPNQASPANSDFRYLMQNHSFGCGLGNGNLSNNLPNNNLNSNLACNQSSAGNQGQDNQQTDNANLFPTACCSTHEDCKPSPEYRSCVQRHGNADFR